MEFIDLHNIFKDNLVISSIPNYFNNSETPIICYKYIITNQLQGGSRDTCGNLTRFVYLLLSIEGVFDNYFLGFWWRADKTPSAECLD